MRLNKVIPLYYVLGMFLCLCPILYAEQTASPEHPVVKLPSVPIRNSTSRASSGQETPTVAVPGKSSAPEQSGAKPAETAPVSDKVQVQLKAMDVWIAVVGAVVSIVLGVLGRKFKNDDKEPAGNTLSTVALMGYSAIVAFFVSFLLISSRVSSPASRPDSTLIKDEIQGLVKKTLVEQANGQTEGLQRLKSDLAKTKEELAGTAGRLGKVKLETSSLALKSQMLSRSVDNNRKRLPTDSEMLDKYVALMAHVQENETDVRRLTEKVDDSRMSASIFSDPLVLATLFAGFILLVFVVAKTPLKSSKVGVNADAKAREYEKYAEGILEQSRREKEESEQLRMEIRDAVRQMRDQS